MLVQVCSLILPMDSIIVDFNADQRSPFILGFPFLAIRSALIDVAIWKLTMRAYDKVEVFNV